MNLKSITIRQAAEAKMVELGKTPEMAKRMANRDIAKALGLLPDGWKGIGTQRARKLLAAHLFGRPIPTLESLGGYRKGVAPPKVQVAVVSPAPRKSFYETREWRAVRYLALVQHGGRCQCCGRSAAEGVVIHVDHVKPRSKFPEMELDITNLQVLCEDCNMGKSNLDVTDWRPKLVVNND